MLWHILVYSALACGVVVFGFFEKLVTKGKWMVEKTDRCPNPEKYPYDVDLHKRKVNRTHDAFYGELEINEPFTEDYIGVTIEACKKVDGGCRTIAHFEDESFCRFMRRHAEENFKEVLRNLGVESESCPVPAGSYKLDDFLFDNREMPEDGMVGHFFATSTIFYKGPRGYLKLACFALHIQFVEKDSADWDDDDEVDGTDLIKYVPKLPGM